MYKNSRIFVCKVSKVQEGVHFSWGGGYIVGFITEEEVGNSQKLKAPL